MARIRGFRWRIVPAFLCGFFGAACVLGGLAHLGIILFVYSRYGLLAPRFDTPSSNLVAISTRNMASVFVSVLGGTAVLWLGVRLWPSWHRREITR